jgi:calcineurin-like phosphoesterase family protein
MEKIQFNKYSIKNFKNIINQTEDQTVYFTSDTHFGHKNILNFCNRPWSTVEEMNEGLIKNWNSVVKENDIVFHLGDMQLGGGNELLDNILPQLNGHIILIIGNHDPHNLKSRHINLIDDAFEQLTVIIDGVCCTLTHCPHGLPGKDPKHQFNLHGHLHSVNNIPQEPSPVILKENHYDVGVDNNNFKPISFDEIKKIIYSRLNNT